MPVSADAFDKWISAMVSLLQPFKVCDIGPGAGKYGKLIKKAAARGGFTSHVTAIEIDASYVEEYGLRSTYDEVIIDDAINMIDTPRVRFDLVMIGDCIEHMRKSAAIDLLNFLVYRSGYICVVYPEEAVQDDWEGHAAEAHISTWSADDFKGWNSLHKTVDHPWCKMHLFLIKGYQRSRPLTDADIVALEQSVDEAERQTSQSASAADLLKAAEAEMIDRPKDPRLHDRFGYLLLEAGQVDRAIKVFQEGLEYAPGDAELLFKLSHAYSHAGRAAEALDAAERAVTARPDQFHPQMHYGYLLLGAGLFERAEAVFRYAELLQSDDPRVPAALADVLERHGRIEEAAAAAERAVALAPGDEVAVNRRDRLRDQVLAYIEPRPIAD